MSRILITGADGFLGRSLVAALAGSGECELLLAQDVREVPAERRLQGVVYERQDVRAADLVETLRRHRIDTVVHLASIVTPGRGSSREFEYSVDVLGTQNLLQACVATGVRHLLVSSSGAAYGYHADNPDWLVETDPLRGNEVFAYSHHKRLVEETLALYRQVQPQLKQTIFRIGTILGETVDNQITALFEKSKLIAIRGSDSPFVFVWDRDVTGAFLHALRSGPERGQGIFNLAGDGALTMDEIAALLGKRTTRFPAGLLTALLWLGSRLGISRYGPEQLDFLRYRPVLLNRRLKQELGYVPSKTSREALLAFIAARAAAGRPL
ncbi:SDR family oxidoreductase [Roseateles violae]|uniref:SDR family oxidoreductase n=1 Tax=Roseateles violae TaxID=3058042 RepID=A0ABT8DMD8_9BURK|nr:SDR family oxidoreductase [Pelomonas sp. PFR6]MDN3919555.1 SDR family oxidoreductase [Pelomonas sp. PFR6]